jgi:uncharacterized sodium:solute symporter family permease YidK
MSEQKPKETVNQLLEQGKGLVEKGNQRHIVVRDADGKKIVDVSFTVAAIIGLVLFFMQPIGWLIAIAASIYGVMKKLKIEVARNLTEEDEVVEMQLPQDDA